MSSLPRPVWQSIVPCVACLGVIFAVSLWQERKLGPLPVSKVNLLGEVLYTSPQAIQRVIEQACRPGFWHLNLTSMVQVLESMAWIKEARVVRTWPFGLQVNLIEHEPLACLNNQIVITADNSLLDISCQNLQPAVPQLQGAMTELNKLTNMLDLLTEELAALDLSVRKLDLVPDQGWRAMLDNEVVIILGENALDARIARFVAAFGGYLRFKTSQIAYIDLRYTNGLAVGWKTS